MEFMRLLRKLFSKEEKTNNENIEIEIEETDDEKEIPSPLKMDTDTTDTLKSDDFAGSISQLNEGVPTRQLNESCHIDQPHAVEKDENQLRSEGIQEFLEKALHEISSESKDEAFEAGRSAIERDHRFDITEEFMKEELIDEIKTDWSSWFFLKQTDKLFCALYYLATESWAPDLKDKRFLCVPGNLSLPEDTRQMSFFKSVLASKRYYPLEPEVVVIRADDEDAPDKYFNLITNTWWENYIEVYPGMVDDAATYAKRIQRELQV